MEEIFHNPESNKLLFHYNKKHNEDSSIPRWILKYCGDDPLCGKLFNIDHVDTKIGFSTKETYGEQKGSILLNGKLKVYRDSDGIVTGEIY